jgi:hypothetical protein
MIRETKGAVVRGQFPERVAEFFAGRPEQNGRLSPQPCRRPLQRDGAKMSLRRDRGKAAVNSAFRATARMLTIQPFAVGRLLEEFHAEIPLRQIWKFVPEEDIAAQ